MLTLFLLYAVVGAVAGILAGLMGIGGGLVVVPMLLYAFQWQALPPEVAMHLALGTSMASIMFTSVSSARAHYLRGAVDTAVIWRISAGILAGTWLGALLASRLPSAWLKIFFVFFLAYVCINMFLNKKTAPSRQLPGLWGMNGMGVVIGVVSSLVGIGGGTLSVPFLLWHNVPTHRAVGTSAGIGFPIAVGGSIGYLASGLGQALPPYCLGYIYLPALAGIVLASVCTAPLGARLAHSLPVPKLKKLFACILLVVGVKMLFEAINVL